MSGVATGILRTSARAVKGWPVAPGGFPPCTVVVGNPWIAGGTGPVLW